MAAYACWDFSAQGGVFAISPESVILKEITRVIGSKVDFNGMFGDNLVRYSFTAPNEETVNALAEILKENVGNPLSSVSAAEIPED